MNLLLHDDMTAAPAGDWNQNAATESEIQMHHINAPTPEAEAATEAFFSRPSNPERMFSLGEVRGFMFALACAPDLVQPSEWLPFICGGYDPQFESREEAQQVMNALMFLFNECGTVGLDDGRRWPPGCEFRDDLLANLEPDAPVSQWSRGFGAGHTWLEESWDNYLPDEWNDEMEAVLATLTFFASRSMAERTVSESRKPGTSLETFTAKLRDVFPEALAEYAEMGRAIWKAVLSARKEDGRPAEAEPRIGRNAPCPCGSGKKYKRCCGSSVR